MTTNRIERHLADQGALVTVTAGPVTAKVALTWREKLFVRIVCGLAGGAWGTAVVWAIMSPACPTWLSYLAAAHVIGVAVDKGLLVSIRD